MAARVAVTEPVAEAGPVAQSEAAKEEVPTREGELEALGEPDSVALPVTERALEGDTVEEGDTATTVQDAVKEGEYATLGDSEGEKVAE